MLESLNPRSLLPKHLRSVPSLVAAAFPGKPGCCASLDAARSKKQTNGLSSQGSGARCLQLLPKQTSVLFRAEPKLKPAPNLSHPRTDAPTPAPDPGRSVLADVKHLSALQHDDTHQSVET